MSLERRERLVEIAHERELLVLEDNPYSLLRYEGDPVPSLHSLDGGVFVMYLGTFSKILSPGIRLGWVVAPPPVLDKINQGKAGTDLCSSTLSQLMVQAYFSEVRWRDYVDSLTQIYRDRRDTMLDALAEHFPPQAQWTRPGGGLFIWATLPDFIDTTDLLARCLRDNVAFVPGEQAYLDGRGRNSMRLNFSISDEETIQEGIRRIGAVLEELVALYGTLTGSEASPPSTVHRPQVDSPEGGRVVRMPERRRRASG
jgi:2-aminoadipate transaminase